MEKTRYIILCANCVFYVIQITVFVFLFKATIYLTKLQYHQAAFVSLVLFQIYNYIFLVLNEKLGQRILNR